ncbi:hypothetical protein [uncultured Corynebacterium sp.]|uniref:hypothetical protein n=1 Tax=uncultured Corynebacterium sp. TaxID=159447 RepID=UPI0025F72B20|nr:hypothetical protein [uncultured Corynebacterium sp.]
MGETKTARPSLKMIIRTLKWAGVRVEGVTDDGPDGARLQLADGAWFNTHNLESILNGAPRKKWRRIIEDFIKPVVDGPPDLAAMGDVEMMKNVHARLVWELPTEFGADAYSYARKFGPFHEVLQLKMGPHLAYLADPHVEGRDVEMLFDAARKNTEKLDCDVEIMSHPKNGGMVWSFRGESNLTASKLPFLPAVMRKAATGSSMRAWHGDVIGHGVLFSMPSRHEILATGMSSFPDLNSIEMLIEVATESRDATGAPGLWFMHWEYGNMEIEPVTFDENPVTGEALLSPGIFRDVVLDLEEELRAEIEELEDLFDDADEWDEED